MKANLGVALALMVLALLVSVPAAAEQQKPRSLGPRLMGAWTLVSDVVEQGDSKIEPFGPHPKGSMILTATGQFTIVITRPDVAKFASDNRMKGTAEEYAAAVQGSIGYFGTYTVTEADRTVHLHIESSTYPNWSGADQKRVVELKGDQLMVSNPTPSVGPGTARLVWKRAKDRRAMASALR